MLAQVVRIGLTITLVIAMQGASVPVEAALSDSRISLEPTPVEVVPGETFNVTLRIEHIPELGMAAYDFQITFTPGVVEFGTSVADHEWPDPDYSQPFVFNVDNSAGYVSFNDVFIDTHTVSGDITLAVLRGRAIADESVTTDLYFEKANIIDPNGEDIPTTVTGGQLKVRTESLVPPTPVPPVATVDLAGLVATTPLRVDAEGFVQATTKLTTSDGKLWLDILAGTRILSSKRDPLTSISAEPEPLAPTPPPEAAIMLAYDLGPDDVTFEPSITLNMEYNPKALPYSFTEEDLYIAYWDELDWHALETIVNTEVRTASCKTNHFTIFAVVSPPAQVQYELVINSTHGGAIIEPGEGLFNYSEGTTVDLVAQAEAGYHFANWTGNIITIDSANDAATTITIDDNYEIIANFIAQYYLTINSTDGGVVNTPGHGTFTYDKGTVINLVVEPEQGYKFENWTGDVQTLADVEAASTTITMQGEYTITANFDEIAPVNWALVGGIIAVIVVGVALAVFVRKRGPGRKHI